MNTVQVVSFDIFDTLLFRINPTTGRIITNPDDMFYLMEKHYGMPGFADKRLESEATLRAETYSPRNKTGFNEITLDGIYYGMKPKFQDMKHREIEWEIENCISNFPAFEWYNDYMKSDKKMIITSDIYLPADVIKEMLTRAHITRSHYSELYLSSEIGKTKSTGHLFDHVIQAENVSPNKILHIGDNKVSDYEHAKKKGLQALWYNGKKLIR